MVQQIHLQNGLFRTHGLYGEPFGPDNIKLLFLGDLKLIIRGDNRERLAPQPLGQPGLILQDLTLNIAAGRIHSSPHISIRCRPLRAEQRAVGTPKGNFHRAEMGLLHRERDEGRRLLLKITFQLSDFLFRILFDGIVQGNFLTGKRTLHTSRSFRMAERLSLSVI